MRTRRHTQPGFAPFRGTAWRRFGRDIGLVALTFAVGYVISSYWIAPGPLTSEDHAIPRVLGLPVDAARTALTTAGFRSRIEGERPSAGVPRGAILWQDPPPSMVVPANATVELVQSAGPAPVTVPDVIGFALPAARKVIEAAGARVGRVDTVRGGDPEPGVVIATRPPPGNGRPRGSAVGLVVSGRDGGGP
jgi:eukaryotic-like serine/threonine-protein kinase